MRATTALPPRRTPTGCAAKAGATAPLRRGQSVALCATPTTEHSKTALPCNLAVCIYYGINRRIRSEIFSFVSSRTRRATAFTFSVKTSWREINIINHNDFQCVLKSVTNNNSAPIVRDFCRCHGVDCVFSNSMTS